VTNPGDNASFRVHLQSLLDVTKALQDQMDTLAKPLDQLLVLSGQGLPLGQFDEAYTLGARHHVVTAGMAELVRSVQQVVLFTADVARTIADGYATYDQDIASTFGGGGGGSGASLTAGPPTDAAVDYAVRVDHPTGIGISADSPDSGPHVANAVNINVVIDSGTDSLAATVRPITGGLPPVIPGAGAGG